MDEIRNKIRAFLAQVYRERALEDDEDIFAAGLSNSLFAMQLVEFIESEFDVEISNDDLDMENFRSIDRMVALVKTKLRREAA